MDGLKELRVGDKVLVEGNPNLGDRPMAGVIVRITPKGEYIVEAGAVKFTFYDNGIEHTSDKWHKRTARMLTTADVARFALNNKRFRVAKLFEVSKGKLTDRQCDKILEILKDEIEGE